MATQTYTYPISSFPNGAVAPDRLAAEVQNSADIAVKLVAHPHLNVAMDGQGNLTPQSVDLTFAAPLSTDEKTALDAIVAAHSGLGLPDAPTTQDGIPYMVPRPDPYLSTPTILSPDWTDPTTWWGTSARFVAQPLTDTGTGLTFQSPHTNWVDLRDGKVTQGHTIWDTYAPRVYVDGQEQDPSTYDFDAAAGTVTFAQAQSGIVTADYSVAQDSTWTVVPNPGTNLELRAVEVQFSEDIVLTTAAVFEVRGAVEVFAPHLAQSNGGPYPDGTRIPLRQRRYERMHNYIDEAQRAYPRIPPLGGPPPRGMSQGMYVFRWPYLDSAGSPVLLEASKGMELAIYLDGHVPFQGERAVCTIYAASIAV